MVWLRDETHHIDEPGLPAFSQGIEFDITERKQAEEQIKRQLEQMAALRRIDAAIGGTFDLKVMLSIVLDNIVQVLDADAVSISLLTSESMNLEVVAAKGFRTSQDPIFALGAFGRHWHEGHARTHRHPHGRFADGGRSRPPSGPHGRGEVRFVLWHAACSQGARDWAIGDLPPISQGTHGRLADGWQMPWLPRPPSPSIAASMFQDLQRSNVDLALAYDATIEGWSRALDLRDKETEGHTQRVTELTLQAARESGRAP